MLIKRALKQATIQLKNKSKTPSLDTEVLLCHALKKDRAYLFAHLDKKLTKVQYDRYKKLIIRRKKHEPVAYIANHKEFYGLDFYINKNVLIPRPETELIVETVLNVLDVRNDQVKRSSNSNIYNKLNIADVGTGSGCITISLAKNLPKAKLHATDISNKALRVAKINAENHKVSSRIKFYHGNLLEPISQRIKFDIIIANLPYLTIDQLGVTEKEVKLHEPNIALAAGKMGDILYKKLIKQIPNYSKNNCQVFFEIDPIFKNKIIKEISKTLKVKKSNIKIIKDLSGLDRVVSFKR